MKYVPWLAVGMLVVAAPMTHAQDFMAASPAAMALASWSLLEDAVPVSNAGVIVAARRSDWWGVPGLTTRALAIHGAWRSGRIACGLSQTGTPEFGWTTGAIAFGVASQQAGAGMRASVRTDRLAPWSVARAVAQGSAIELGCGAWLRPASAIAVTVHAPQLVQRGATPLARPLGCELRYGVTHALWLALRAPSGGLDGERACGAALAIPPCLLWGELRDAPLRASTGVAFTWRSLRCDLRLDEHPALGESVHASLAWSSAWAMP